MYYRQKYGEDFAKFCGLLRIYELYPLYFPIAGLMVTFAQDVYLIYAGRAITGFCIGIISLSLPVYLAEAIHPEVRGTLGLLPTSLGEVICFSCKNFFKNSS